MRTIKAGRMLTGMDERSIGPTAVTIGKDGRIASIEAIPPGSLSPGEAGLLLMPALSNAHDHGRGLSPLAFGAADQRLESWAVALGRQPRVDPYLNAAVAFARLAESGVCAVNHCHNTQDGRALLAEAEAVSRAARDVGIAVAFAWPFFDRNATVYGDLSPLLDRLPESRREGIVASRSGLRSCEENLRLIDRAAAFEHALFRIQYHPVAPQWVEQTTLEAIAVASRRDGRRIHTHLFETRRQREWADKAYPDGLLTFLDEIGLLSPRLTVAHAVWLRPDEIALLVERGVTVSANVSSNLRLRSGLPPIAELTGAGASLAYGLDGMALDDDQDMLRELRLARLSAARSADLTDAMVWRAAWQTGRRTILGDDGGGRIMVGAPADLVTLDFATLSADCIVDDLDTGALALARAQKRHVVHMFVGGREIVGGGHCRSVDLPALERGLVTAARAAYRTNPPSVPALDELGRAIEDFYEGGCHCSAS